MGGKKKGKGEKKDKKAKVVDEEDFSTRDLLAYYKKYCKELEIQPFKNLEAKLTELVEENGNLTQILINEKIGEFGARALFNALRAVK
jgi:hypothetical protein